MHMIVPIFARLFRSDSSSTQWNVPPGNRFLVTPEMTCPHPPVLCSLVVLVRLLLCSPLDVAFDSTVALLVALTAGAAGTSTHAHLSCRRPGQP